MTHPMQTGEKGDRISPALAESLQEARHIFEVRYLDNETSKCPQTSVLNDSVSVILSIMYV